MDATTETLIPAAKMAAENTVRMPGESPEYRAARTALLAEEIELRRHMERVAAQMRALPPGGAVTGDYRFQTEDGPSDFAGLFGDKETLGVFSYMFGPQRARPCPMCTNVLDAMDSNALDLAQHMSLVVVARSPIERLVAWKRERGWRRLRRAPAVVRRRSATGTRCAAGRPAWRRASSRAAIGWRSRRADPGRDRRSPPSVRRPRNGGSFHRGG